MSIYNPHTGLKTLDFETLKQQEIIPLFKEQFGEQFNTCESSTNHLLINTFAHTAFNFYSVLQAVTHAKDIRLAAGQELNKMADRFGITRNTHEDDNHFRIRIIQEKTSQVATHLSFQKLLEIDGVDEIKLYDPLSTQESLKVEAGTQILILYSQTQDLTTFENVQKIGQKIFDLKSAGIQTVFLDSSHTIGSSHCTAHLTDYNGFAKAIHFHIAKKVRIDMNIFIHFTETSFQPQLTAIKKQELTDLLKNQFNQLGRNIPCHEVASLISYHLKGVDQVIVNIDSLGNHIDYMAKADQFNDLKNINIDILGA